MGAETSFSEADKPDVSLTEETSLRETRHQPRFLPLRLPRHTSTPPRQETHEAVSAPRRRRSWTSWTRPRRRKPRNCLATCSNNLSVPILNNHILEIKIVCVSCVASYNELCDQIFRPRTPPIAPFFSKKRQPKIQFYCRVARSTRSKYRPPKVSYRLKTYFTT